MDNSHGTQKMEVWKMNFLFNWVMFRFYVNFPVCTGWLGLLACSRRVVQHRHGFCQFLDGSKKAGKTKLGSRCAGAEAGIRVPTRKLKRSYWIFDSRIQGQESKKIEKIRKLKNIKILKNSNFELWSCFLCFSWWKICCFFVKLLKEAPSPPSWPCTQRSCKRVKRRCRSTWGLEILCDHLGADLSHDLDVWFVVKSHPVVLLCQILLCVKDWRDVVLIKWLNDFRYIFGWQKSRCNELWRSSFSQMQQRPVTTHKWIIPWNNGTSWTRPQTSYSTKSLEIFASHLHQTFVLKRSVLEVPLGCFLYGWKCRSQQRCRDAKMEEHLGS